MNPTDQERKQQRKRELKKNKKQRQVVRQAVLKGKNPREIIEELEKIDDMEYNPVMPCPHAPKVRHLFNQPVTNLHVILTCHIPGYV